MSALIRHLLLCCSLVGGILHAVCATAAEPLPEYTVKAGYLYNFAMLTDWPAEARYGNLEVCTIGNDGFAAVLATLQGKTVNQRSINIRTLAHPGEVKGCHVLFIAEVGRTDWAQLKRQIARQPVLTVTDNDGLAKSGIAILLRPEQQRLVFEIDIEAARLANLSISARLLQLARGGIVE